MSAAAGAAGISAAESRPAVGIGASGGRKRRPRRAASARLLGGFVAPALLKQARPLALGPEDVLLGAQARRVPGADDRLDVAPRLELLVDQPDLLAGLEKVGVRAPDAGREREGDPLRPRAGPGGVRLRDVAGEAELPRETGTPAAPRRRGASSAPSRATGRRRRSRSRR